MNLRFDDMNSRLERIEAAQTRLIYSNGCLSSEAPLWEQWLRRQFQYCLADRVDVLPQCLMIK